jgi:PIN domain nuclease of toxin-antitoxin system
MRLLLDTHVFIWWADAPERLTSNALAALEDDTNDLILSVVSLWEIQIKIQLGKLKLARPLKELVESQQATNGLQLLPIELPHVLALAALPLHHKDPFDRMLIAQSMVEDLTLITADDKLAAYPAKLLR